MLNVVRVAQLYTWNSKLSPLAVILIGLLPPVSIYAQFVWILPLTSSACVALKLHQIDNQAFTNLIFSGQLVVVVFVAA